MLRSGNTSPTTMRGDVSPDKDIFHNHNYNGNLVFDHNNINTYYNLSKR
jgi:hypothetical protein